MGRFWVFGPITSDQGEILWAVSDGLDMPGMKRATKPGHYQEFWPNEQAAEKHAKEMNREVHQG